MIWRRVGILALLVLLRIGGTLYALEPGEAHTAIPCLRRERLKAGDGDSEVIAFIVARYGAYVRLKPPFDPSTYALWFGPPAVLVIALLVVVRATRRRRPSPLPLDADERRRIDALRDDSP